MEANREIVEALCRHLTEAFKKFADSEANKSEEGLTYIDAMMGCHNFYKTVILDLERRTGAKVIRQVAIDTLTKALKK